MLVTMPEPPQQTCSHEFPDQTLQADINLEPQTQAHVAELEQALKFEVALRQIIEKVHSFLEEGDIFQTVVQELALVLEAACSISLSIPGQQELAHYEYSASALEYLNWRTQIRENSEIYQQLRQGTPAQFCFNPNLLQAQVSLFGCSLTKADEILGELWVARETANVLSESEIRLVQQVAKQCTIAIHQSRLYRAAQTHIEELKRLNEVKDDFLNQVTHDLRSPLSNMRLVIHMLEHQLTTGKPYDEYTSQQNSAYSKTLTHLKVLQTECEREITLVNNLLDLQCLESEKQSLNLDAINLQKWLIDLIEPFEEQIQQRQLTLELNIAPNLPMLMSDPANLHRVLSELLHNACKYTPPNETISLSVSSNLEHVQIKVSNSGVEISDGELPRIFDKFYRIPGSDHWKQGGTGLGLALVEKLVSCLGGTIDANSRNGQTCFTIELPL